MSEKSSFFNSVGGDRIYQAGDFASYFNKFITNGYFPENENSLKVFENSGFNTMLMPGASYSNGYMYENTSNLTLTHSVADGVLNRIDRVVIRLDFLSRSIVAAVKSGTVSSTPAAPALQRDGDIYELGVADVYIRAGATSIIQSDITDTRGNSQLCGAVNNLFAVQNVQATSVYVNDASHNYDNSNLEAILEEIRMPLTTTRSGLNELNGYFAVVEEKRRNGTLYRRKTLSNLQGAEYRVQTVEYFDTAGTNVLKTEIYDLTWDSFGNVIGCTAR